ncbi:winged helix-turn-helix domain-containing protein [Phormidesmis priestleyi]
MLERHGWRQLMPRPYHPAGDKQAQETFKKLSHAGANRSSRPG